MRVDFAPTSIAPRGFRGGVTASNYQNRVVLFRYSHVYVEMEPGDALFFHSNLLHTSDQNKVIL